MAVDGAQVLAGCWSAASVSYHVGFSIELAMTWQLVYPGVHVREQAKERAGVRVKLRYKLKCLS